MMVRAGSGWQTVLADLSLILFMTTAAAVNEAAPDRAATQSAYGRESVLPALAEPVAVWMPSADGPDLSVWLARSAADPRLQLTILALPANAGAALELARRGGRPARIILDPAAPQGVRAMLGYDQGGLARALQNADNALPWKETSR